MRTSEPSNRSVWPSAQVIKFHPQSERAEAVAPAPAEDPAVAVEAATVEVAEVETVTTGVAGIRPDPEAVEWHRLAHPLEVREDESGDERHRAEPVQVMLGQLEARAQRREELALLVHVLRRALGHQPRNPEDDAVGGRLVLELPVLQIREALVAGADERGVLLEREARLHPPGHGAGVVPTLC